MEGRRSARQSTAMSKSLLGVLLISSVSVYLQACSGSTGGERSRPTVQSNGSWAKHMAEADGKLPPGVHERPIDGDDYRVLNFGHAASVSQTREVKVLVRRYYAAAAAADGKRACSLLYFIQVEAIPEDYGHVRRLRGRTCGEVLSKLFKLRHALLAGENASLRIGRIRLASPNGFVILRFAGSHEWRQVALRHVGRRWTFRDVNDVPLP
jgi:hypothetical protein